MIAEANDPVASGGDLEGKNLDRIKHILKRIGFQQAAIDYQTSRTNKLLIALAVIAIIPTIETIVKFINWIIDKI